MKTSFYILSSSNTILNEIEESARNIESLDVFGGTEEIARAEQILSQEQIDILLVNPEGEQVHYDFIEKAAIDHPSTKIIVLEDSINEQTLHNILYLGAKDVIVKPYNLQKLADSISRVEDLEEKQKQLSIERTYNRSKENKGDIITVFSTKGGVGKTFISTNFAVALAENTNKRVALVDLDLDYGNVALALNLLPKSSILDVVNDMEHIDKDLIESYMLPHESGLKVLASNISINLTDNIKESDVKTILELLEESFDYIIVDMPSKFNQNSIPALALADHLLVIATQELAAIQNVKSLLLSLEELNFPSSKISIILNKYNKKGDINIKDISRSLKREINHNIGLDHKGALISLNKGVAYVKDYPKRKITREIKNLITYITGEKLSRKKTRFSIFKRDKSSKVTSKKNKKRKK